MLSFLYKLDECFYNATIQWERDMGKTSKFLYIFIIYCTMSFAQNIKVVTEYFPPFQWEEDGVMTGPSTEVIQAVLEKIGTKSSIEMYPWARAYNMALKEKNVLIYSIAKIKKREKLFKWAGSIMTRNMYFWKLKNRNDIHIKTIEDAKEYKTASVNMDVRSQYLFNQGFDKNKNLYMVSKNEATIKLLFSGRVDFIMDNHGLKAQVEKYGYDFDKLEKILPVVELSGEVYAAFSLATTDEIVNKFKYELKQLKDNGEYSKIMKKYEYK